MPTHFLRRVCELYNMALQQRRDAYRELWVSVNYLQQVTQLRELRNRVEEYTPFLSVIQGDQLRHLNGEFQAFFRV